MTARKIPADVARVVDVFRKLGHAARRGLWLSERKTEKEIKDAAKAADALRRR